jgi:hypothetical protein
MERQGTVIVEGKQHLYFAERNWNCNRAIKEGGGPDDDVTSWELREFTSVYL